MKKAYGCIALIIGIFLLWLPFRLLGTSSGAPGDGGPDYGLVIQCLDSLAGSLIALTFAWHFLKARPK